MKDGCEQIGAVVAELSGDALEKAALGRGGTFLFMAVIVFDHVAAHTGQHILIERSL